MTVEEYSEVFPCAEQGRFVLGCNYWASRSGTAMWSDWQPEVVDEDFRKLADAGLQILRVFPLWPEFQPITSLYAVDADKPYEIRHGEEVLPSDDFGAAGVSAEAMRHFSEFTAMASRHNLKLIVALITGYMSGRQFVPPALVGRNVLTDPFALMWENRFIKCFVKHFIDCPSISAWELGNECNCLSDVPTRESAFVWSASVVDAIRSVDRRRPIISGMHGLKTDGKWTIQDQAELTDVLTTHPYPLFTPHCDQDPINTMRPALHAACESQLYHDIGKKPCFAEELGTLGPMICSDDIAGDYVRSSLFSLYAHDCGGLIWWCNHDNEKLEHAPYDWWALEQELGLFRSNGTSKPVLHQMSSFRKLLDSLPFGRLPERVTDAVCILTENINSWGVAYSAFVLAKQAGYDIRFQHSSQPMRDSDFYIIPSLNGHNSMNRRAWLELLARVRSGATLYMSIDGALLSHFTEFTGLRVITRQRRTENVKIRFHGIEPAMEFSMPSPFRLDVEAVDAEVLGCENDGNPIFTCGKCGKGKVYCLSLPMESALAQIPGAFRVDSEPYWAIYRRMLDSKDANRVVRKEDPMLGVTEHPVDDANRVIIAVNYQPGDMQTEIHLRDGWCLGEAMYGEVCQASGSSLLCRLAANDAAIFTVKSSQ